MTPEEIEIAVKERVKHYLIVIATMFNEANEKAEAVGLDAAKIEFQAQTRAVTTLGTFAMCSMISGTQAPGLLAAVAAKKTQ